ncbi:MAG TPA: TMEM175 family protein [Bacteroidia bacterium]|nr:TMEM175 family protein [Bacteroidia bacterium]
MQKLNYTFDKRRFETFIDAVIAIILTILVLELKVPEESHGADVSTKDQVISLLPFLLSYVGSFLLIAGIWIDHHTLFLNVHSITKRYIFLNMIFILMLSLVPFTTAFAGKNHHDPFAVALLFSNYFIMNISFAALYWYGYYKNLIPKAFFTDNEKNKVYSSLGLLGLIIAIPVAYLNTYLSFILGIIIFSFHLLKKK